MPQLNEVSALAILSPHLDDAIFSLGGWLKNLTGKARVSIINIFSRSGFVHGSQTDVETGSHIRKAEDAFVLVAAGVNAIHNLDVPEALERGRSLGDIFLDTLPKEGFESALIIQVRAAIEQVLPPGSIILSPAGFGGHIDHLITRQAAETLPGVMYYAELPYAARTARTQPALSFVQNRQVEVVPASAVDIEQHEVLARLYGSQIQEKHIEEIRQHLASRGYLFWS